MSQIGNRAYLEIQRPEKEIVSLFKDIPIACIADNMNRISCVDQSLKNYGGRSDLLGTAFTVKVPEGDNLLFHMALDLLQEGDVLIVDGNGCMHRSLCGEIMCTYAFKRGCAGMVVDGVIRDVEGISRLPIPVYARGVQANGPFKNGLGEINRPVAVGGIVIYPGDIIVGDADGVVAIRPQEAVELAEKALSTFRAEGKLLETMRSTGQWDRKSFWDAIEKSNVEQIDGLFTF